MDGFALTKWYLDVVDEAGRSAIVYWSEISWGPFAVRWEELSSHEPGRTPEHRSNVGAGPAPTRTDGAISWQSSALTADLVCVPWSRAFETRLLERDEGALDWWCEAAGADVTLTRGAGRIVRGAGYAERIVLTIPPWKLPITELRWGRWGSAGSRRSLVWIDWRGASPLTLVLVDGVPREGAVVGDGIIRCGGEALTLTPGETLHARPLGEVLGRVRPIAGVLPGPWRTVEDRKLRSVGTLWSGHTAVETGWAVSETVRFPWRERESG